MPDFPQIPGYRIERELGQGGMATVYLAVQERLNRHVAIKVLSTFLLSDSQFIQRFLKEAQTAAGLHHSNIIPIYDVGRVGDFNYIIMEHMEGNLKDRIKHGPLKPGTALEIVFQIARALDYAHEQGFIHRDIKPENIMFRRDRTAVLADFGIARAVDSTTRLTKTGMSIGTPHYMSPEQARGKKLDGRSDIYSLGVVFYEMLTGKVPYDAEDSVAVILKHIQEPIPELPASLSRCQPLLTVMMAKDPEARVKSGVDLSRRVQEYGGAGKKQNEILENVSLQSKSIISPGLSENEADDKNKLSDKDFHADKAAWEMARGLDTERAYERYLSIYPSGQHEAEANQRIGEIHRIESKGKKTERKLRAEEKRKDVQIIGQAWREPVTGMEFVWVPGGEFKMGSNSREAFDDEKPVHRVHVEGFWMGKYEVTQGQWKAVMDSNPSNFNIGDNYPVENVSWEDAQEFIRRINSRSGQTYRLPTEAEWEYACRAGTTQDRYGNLDDIAWYDNNSGSSTHPVGQKRPNSYGLYDMLGNVFELCQDWYGPYSSGCLRNPRGSSSGSYRILRGGSWFNDVRNVRAAVRICYAMSDRHDVLGFRLVRTK